MSVASYEGPASRREVGDQRFLETAILLGATPVEFATPADEQPKIEAAAIDPQQAGAVGQVAMRRTEVV